MVKRLEQECNSKSHLFLTVKLDFLIKSERIFVRSDFYSGQVRLNFQEFSFDQIFTLRSGQIEFSIKCGIV